MGIQERKEREKEQRKDEILSAAQKVFFNKGLLFSTMDEIAETAELSKGTLYLYYKSKEDLYLAVMAKGLGILLEMFIKVLHTKESTLKKILLLEKSYLEFYRSSPNYFRMMQFSQLPHFHKQVSDEMREICHTENKKLWEPALSLIQSAIDEGLIKKEFAPIELAIIFWSSITALLIRIDNEYEIWKKEMQIDLKHTLNLSNDLLWYAILTDNGKKEYELIKIESGIL